jgi:hypothetical protein
LAVVNIVKLKSNLLIIGPNERALATAAFQDNTTVKMVPNDNGEPFLMDLGESD